MPIIVHDPEELDEEELAKAEAEGLLFAEAAE